MNRLKGPRIIIDFSDELVRHLAADKVKEAIKEVLAEEASLDVKGAAAFMGISQTEVRRHAKRSIPAVVYGERTTRFRLKDLIAFRDKNIIYPPKQKRQ